MKTHINKRILVWVLAVIMASLSAFTSFAGVADDAIVEADESSALPYYAREWNSSDEIKLGGKNVHSADMFGEDPTDHYSDLMIDDADEELLRINFDPEAFDYRKNKTYVEMIMEVTRITKLNPFVTAAMIIQEQGVNPSDNPLTTGAGLPDGRYAGVYNLLNINAYAADGMGAQERGLWWAGGEDIEKTSYGRPWDTPERSIFRGMGMYVANYFEEGQDTFYFKKFNTSKASWDEGGAHWKKGETFIPTHQYMDNIAGAENEGKILGDFYRKQGLDKENLTFYIPVYHGMPDKETEEYTKGIDEDDEAAKQIVEDFGEYQGYVDRLLYLHEKHKTWTFVKKETPAEYDGVKTTWDEIVKGESGENRNLSTVSGNYTTTKKDEVAYYLDPRNFLKDESCVYQFLYQDYCDDADTYMNSKNVATAVKDTFLAKAVMRHDKEYSVNVIAGTGIKAVTGSGKYKPGETVTLNATLESGYTNLQWTGNVTVKDSSFVMRAKDVNVTASATKSGGGGGGGTGGGSASGSSKGPDNGAPAYSPRWQKRADGKWFITRTNGQIVTNAWLCDDVISSNGKKVWYLLQADGTMLTAGLVQDKSGNFYSMEMDPHNQHYGMLRYKSGYYNCNGQQIYLELEENNISSLGAIKNADAIAKLKSIYGLTTYPIGNETATYTSNF